MKWMRWLTNWLGGTTKSFGSLGIGLRAALSGGAPGGWASDHREETTHNTGFNYVAIHAIAAQVAGATVTVFADGESQVLRRAKRKTLANCSGTFARWKSIYGADDRETDPLPGTHPLVRLLKRPNPYESGANFRYRQAQQIRLTGTCLVWNVPSRSGPTCERYVIPTAMASPIAPTQELPRGGWRINPVASRYTPVVDNGYVDCPSWYRILGQIVDARQIQMIRLPHAWYLDDGQSPLSAGAKWVDSGDAVDAARYHQLKNGIDPSVVWNLPPDVSPDQDEIDRVQAKISAKYGGPENVGRVMVAQNGTSITPLTTTPKDMCYTEGFHDFKAAILALHQTPPVAVGLQEPGAYAAYNASMEAWRHAAVQPLCDMLAESDTEHLAPQFGTGLTIEIESDTVDDTDLIESQLRNDLAAKVRTRNEWRSVRGMPPLPGSIGDELVGAGSDHASPETTSGHAGPPISSEPLEIAKDSNADKFHPKSHRSSNRVTTIRRSQHVDSDHDDMEFRATLIAEILYGLYGASVLHDAGFIEKAKPFDPDKHPRDEHGRFTNTGTDEQIEAAKKIISRILNGDRLAANPDTLATHLSVLNTDTLVSLHKDHGVAIPPTYRPHLVRSLMVRLEIRRDSTPRKKPKRSADAVDVYVQAPDVVNQRLPGRDDGETRAHLTEDQWRSLSGAQSGSQVYVFPRGFSEVHIFVDHPAYRAHRSFTASGEMRNISMQVAPRMQKQGIGTRALLEQVNTATKLGFHVITLDAVGEGDRIHSEAGDQKRARKLRGYYAWAKLGFTGDIRSLMNDRRHDPSKEIREIARDFKNRFPGVTDVGQLIRTEGGSDWWKNYGGAFEGKFDLREPSLSRVIIAEYLAEKAAEQKGKTRLLSAMEFSSNSEQSTDNLNRGFNMRDDRPDDVSENQWPDFDMPDVENPDILSPEDEAILDRIWARIAKEFPVTTAITDNRSATQDISVS